MISSISFDKDLLARIGKELGDCDFTDESQIRFLRSTTSCDVQAAPGNGKTTLLVAKMVILSHQWDSRRSGVCVISHTNAARDEVERHLSKHPTAAAFLLYPHFIGTVTAFLNYFLALPYLRGLGWTVQRIDDEHFESRALKAYSSKTGLLAQARVRNGACKNQVETWVRELELATDFECPAGERPQRLKVRHQKGQHGPQTACGRELEELKATMTNEGLFRYADLTTLAERALSACPAIGDRLRSRFPLVILDEAQDTTGTQLAILERIFRSPGVAFQRLGDLNQMLYERADRSNNASWVTSSQEISLPVSRRFGPEIAAFASRLTVRSPQEIIGLPNLSSKRLLLLFDKESIAKVIPTYGAEVRAYWPQREPSTLDVWAVASRHSPYKQRGAWPKSLTDYYPEYRAGVSKSNGTLCELMRQASLLFSGGAATSEILSLLAAGLTGCLRRAKNCHSSDGGVAYRSVWFAIRAIDPNAELAIRLLFRNRILLGSTAWEKQAWHAFCTELNSLLRLTSPSQAMPTQLGEYLTFPERESDMPMSSAPQASPTHRTIEGLTVKFGSIFSLKGRTVDSILILQSELYHGQKTTEQAMDLEVVLPSAFGADKTNLSAGVNLAAATNIFVGATRAREFLGLALLRGAASEELLAAAVDQGWQVRDLTTPVTQTPK